MLIEKNIYTLFGVDWGVVKHDQGKSKPVGRVEERNPTSLPDLCWVSKRSESGWFYRLHSAGHV